MAHDTINQSMAELRQSSQHLQQQTQFAHRQAATGAQRARSVSAELAELDLEKAFRQLREMVALVSGKPRIESNNVVHFNDHLAVKAAE